MKYNYYISISFKILIMGLLGQKTKADFIEWEKLQTLILKLERDNEKKFALLISIGIYSGLRISDILTLRWADVIEKDVIELYEKKTNKYRKIKINNSLREIIERLKPGNISTDDLIFLNRFNKSAFSCQYVNRRLKEIAEKYKITKTPENIKSHSFRKSFGRRVFENNDNSEKSLIFLSEMFNHSNIKTTKNYTTKSITTMAVFVIFKMWCN